MAHSAGQDNLANRNRRLSLNHLKDKVREATAFLESKLHGSPETGVITGTGLGEAIGPLENALTLNYADIPHFPVSTVVGHSGRLLAGTLAGHPVMVMQGRFHLYEGYAPDAVTFPVRVMQALGVRHLIRLQCGRRHEPRLWPGGPDGNP